MLLQRIGGNAVLAGWIYGVGSGITPFARPPARAGLPARGWFFSRRGLRHKHRIQPEQNVKSAAFFKAQNPVRNIVHVVLLDYLAALRARCRSDPCEKEPKVIVDFSRGGNG